MHKRLRSVACFLALLVLVGPSCLKQGSNRVGMKRVAADLQYGVSPLSEAATPPGAIPQIPEIAEPLDELAFTFRPPGAQLPSFVRCPEAGPNDFPDEAAPIDVTARPKPGGYIWRVKGTVKGGVFPFPIPLIPLSERIVQGVGNDPLSPGNPNNFVFQTREKDPVDPRIEITQSFRVNQENPDPRVQTAGVFLTQVERKNSEDGTTRVFRPTPAINYLPLPVRPGPEFRSAGTSGDPTAPPPDQDTNPFEYEGPAQALTHVGVVKDRIRIDVCGKVVDSWYVEAQQTHAAGATTRQVRFNYAIAPHFGALLLFEHVESPCTPDAEGKCTPEPDLIYDKTIGQLEPDAAP